MESETLAKKRRRSDDSPAAAAPRWVMLRPNIITRDSSNSSLADAKTSAASCTSSGQYFSLYCVPAPPPASSSFYCDWLCGAPGDGKYPEPEDLPLCVVAAHDDVVLIQIGLPKRKDDLGFYDYHYDQFLYEAGAGRPPLLSLLPSCYVSLQLERNKESLQLQDPSPSRRARSLDSKSTGVLRRSEGKIVVVQLELGYEWPYERAELCVLRLPRRRKWVIKGVPVIRHHHHREEEDEVPGRWGPRPEVEAAVPVGNRFMCWVDYHTGFYLCDMAKKKNPKLRYVPLPMLAYDDTSGDPRDFHWPRNSLNLAAAGPDAVRFVGIAPRCCCGGPGKTSCERSSFAFKVTTWTMNVRTAAEAEATWVKERVVDCDELWKQLPSYGDIEHQTFEYPIVSADDPDVVWFTVDQRTVEINTKSKVLLSVVRCDFNPYVGACHLPAKLHW